MRRAAVWIALLGSIHGVFLGTAGATPWGVTGEVGAELDSNVQRVESGSDVDTASITAWVMRFGARAERKGKLAGGNLVFNLSDLTRVVADSDVAVENVTVLASNLRWLHQLGDRPVFAGVGLSAIDALPLSDDIGARTFRNLAADGVLGMRSEHEHELMIAFGGRDFAYKPDHKFDWRGPAANVRLELVLWQSEAKTKSLELVTSLGFENRAFNDKALVNGCAPNEPPNPNCSGATDIQRRDRYQRLGAELMWVGHQVAAVGYQLAVIDSNDFGQSLARHRFTASGTAALPGRVYATLLAILQIDQYLDGRIVRGGVQEQEFASIDDENRSSLQLRVARTIAGQWAVEGRGAIWRNLSGNAMELDFRRELVYVGLVYGR